ncbi:MAG: hypothetical protein RL689_1117 [Planctomycetota bacterium]|jgi:hypothetical protein
MPPIMTLALTSEQLSFGFIMACFAISLLITIAKLAWFREGVNEADSPRDIVRGFYLWFFISLFTATTLSLTAWSFHQQLFGWIAKDASPSLSDGV